MYITVHVLTGCLMGLYHNFGGGGEFVSMAIFRFEGLFKSWHSSGEHTS